MDAKHSTRKSRLPRIRCNCGRVEATAPRWKAGHGKITIHHAVDVKIVHVLAPKLCAGAKD